MDSKADYMKVKPLLGVMPQWLWLESRGLDLCGAIARRIQNPKPTPEDTEDIQRLVSELAEIVAVIPNAR